MTLNVLHFLIYDLMFYLISVFLVSLDSSGLGHELRRNELRR